MVPEEEETTIASKSNEHISKVVINYTDSIIN